MTPYYQHAGMTIYHGDARDVLASLPSSSIDLVLTDPPFGVRGESWDIFTDDQAFSAFTVSWLTEAYRLAPVVATFFADKYVPLLRVAAARAEIPYRRALVWRKPPGSQFAGASLDGFWFDFEMIQVFGKPTTPKRVATQFGVLEHRTVIGQLHGCEKPVALLCDLLDGYSNAGDMVLDPFLGSGTTLVAAKMLGRQGIGIEISEAYCEIATKRLQQEVLPMAADPEREIQAALI